VKKGSRRSPPRMLESGPGRQPILSFPRRRESKWPVANNQNGSPLSRGRRAEPRITWRPCSNRCAISATNLRASANLPMRGSGCDPVSSSSVTSFSSCPNASWARLAISSGTFLRRRLSSAFLLTSSVSAAKSTQNGGLAALRHVRDVDRRRQQERRRQAPAQRRSRC